MWRTWCRYDLDYRTIFDLAEDRNNPKNLEICKQHVVFQHFPIQRLQENPGVWSMTTYKYGELIAKDLHNIDWIYVIKSGEARVLKYLQPNNIDVKARRRKVQAMINSQSPFYRKKQILNFVEEREYIKSAYRPNNYQPSVSPSRLSLRSAPANRSSTTPLLPHTSLSMPNTRQESRNLSPRKPSEDQTHAPKMALPRLVLDSDVIQSPRDQDAKVKDTEVKENGQDQVVVVETTERLPGDQNAASQPASYLKDKDTEKNRGTLEKIGTGPEEGESKAGVKKRASEPAKLGADLHGKRLMERRLSADMQGGLFEKPLGPGQSVRRKSILVPREGAQTSSPALTQTQTAAQRGGKRRGRSASYLKTPHASTARGSQVIQVGRHTLPAFVQVDTLHPGQIFGLRACLDPEERGPSVSLVSGQCEVLQINKKFFMRHCDDAIYSLIRLKNKPFPSEEDLIDRLDVNMQWEEYKQHTLNTFLKECRSAR